MLGGYQFLNIPIGIGTRPFRPIHILVDYLVLNKLFNAFFNFILYMKRDNLTMFDVFMWN
jgi:hypothetical protein